VVSATPWPVYAPERDLIPLVQEAGLALGQVWSGAEGLACIRIQSVDRPACSKSLYGLSFLNPFAICSYVYFLIPCVRSLPEAMGVFQVCIPLPCLYSNHLSLPCIIVCTLLSTLRVCHSDAWRYLLVCQLVKLILLMNLVRSKIPVFWVVTLDCWSSGSRHFRGTYDLWNVRNHLAISECLISEDRNSGLHHCDNLTTHIYNYSCVSRLLLIYSCLIAVFTCCIFVPCGIVICSVPQGIRIIHCEVVGVYWMKVTVLLNVMKWKRMNMFYNSAYSFVYFTKMKNHIMGTRNWL
jgi:hypothetical protein